MFFTISALESRFVNPKNGRKMYDSGALLYISTLIGVTKKNLISVLENEEKK